MGSTDTLADSACATRKHAEWSSSRVSTLPHLDLSQRFDTNVAEKVPAAQKRSQEVKPIIATKAKPTVTVPNPKPTQQLHLVWSQPFVDQSPLPMSLPKVSKTREDDAGMSMPDKGKAAVGVKRRLAKDATDPTAKRAHVDVHQPDLEVVENLAGLMDSTWDEVVKAREAVSTAEERLWAVEGRLRMIDGWVWDMHRQA